MPLAAASVRSRANSESADSSRFPLARLPLAGDLAQLVAGGEECHAVGPEDTGRAARLQAQHAEEQVLVADRRLPEDLGLVGGQQEDPPAFLGQRQLVGAWGLAGQSGGRQLGAQRGGVDLEPAEELLDDVVGLAQQPEQQVLGLDLPGPRPAPPRSGRRTAYAGRVR